MERFKLLYTRWSELKVDEFYAKVGNCLPEDNKIVDNDILLNVKIKTINRALVNQINQLN